MTFTKQIAKHFKEVFYGGNWTASNLQEQLIDVTHQEAKQKIGSLNTILTLTYHIHYYVRMVLQVLEGGKLEGNDTFSFDHPQITSEEEWQNMKEMMWLEANCFIACIEEIPDEKLLEVFVNEKYGIMYRNLQGIVEHSHYHLGQIALLKKLIRSENL
ncbi:MAG: putative damage-inducible protein DinB [Bacteroidia bacterium]|jgi:uncharacterized damage-inducible protein DinB